MKRVFAIIRAFISKFWTSRKQVRPEVSPRETSKDSPYKEGDPVELNDYAEEILPLEVIQIYGRHSTYEIVMPRPADGMLGERHPQIFFLRQRRDQIMMKYPHNLENVVVSGAMVRRRRKHSTASLLKTQQKLELVR